MATVLWSVVGTLAGLSAHAILDRPATLHAVYRGGPGNWPAPWIDADVIFTELAALPPLSDIDPAKVALGSRLFHDVSLSAHGQLACASCHNPDHGWTIDRPTDAGGGRSHRRNPPSLYTAPRLSHWGWDGRGQTLATQTFAPLIAPDEMANAGIAEVIARLQRDSRYTGSFAAIYGVGPITDARLADVLVSFQSSLDNATRFDRFMRGDSDALNDSEIDGLHVFRTKGRCANCHHGALLTDQQFHNLKLSSFGEASADLGRYGVTGQLDDVGRFRTPSLRHVGTTAPYMHNGLFATLEGVINLYDRGGGEVWARNAVEAAHPLYAPAAKLSSHIRPLDLSDQEKAALAAFLRTL